MGIKLYTNAPAAYDYGVEVEADTGYRLNSGCDQDKPLRLIEVADEWRAGIQKDRNLSGLYPTLTEAEFEQWIADEFLVREETDND